MPACGKSQRRDAVFFYAVFIGVFAYVGYRRNGFDKRRGICGFYAVIKCKRNVARVHVLYCDGLALSVRNVSVTAARYHEHCGANSFSHFLAFGARANGEIPASRTVTVQFEITV